MTAITARLPKLCITKYLFLRAPRRFSWSCRAGGKTAGAATEICGLPLCGAANPGCSRLSAGSRQSPKLSHPRDERGFALLLVFLMASIVAISLYMELPRVAFQAERQKEQLLMERGYEYKRAIGLFLRTNKNTRWPASMEELESFNNRRYLRKRYIDPMTGKDEWRLIHIQNGVLQDSVTNKKPNSQTQSGLQATGFINEVQGFGQQSSGTQTTNPGLRRRPSDGGSALGPDGQPIQSASGGTGSTGNYPGVPALPGSGAPVSSAGGVLPGIPPGAPGGQGGIAGIIGGSPSGASGPTGNQGFGGLMGGLTGGGLTGGGTSVQPTIPGAPPQGFPGSGTPGVNGLPGGIQINSTAQAAAAGLLQNLLTQPRPGGLPGIASQASGGVIMGSGIAGVASKAEGESIMVYGDRTDFSEWEFIYDPMKFHVQNPNSGNGASGIGVPASQLASTGGMSSPGGTPVSSMPGGPQANGGANTAGFSLGGPSATSNVNGAPGSSVPGGGTPAPAAAVGSPAFGAAGLDPDIRPGKK